MHSCTYNFNLLNIKTAVSPVKTLNVKNNMSFTTSTTIHYDSHYLGNDNPETVKTKIIVKSSIEVILLFLILT